MKKNVGGIDLQLRYLLGAIFVLIALFAPLDLGWKIVLLVIAAIAFITAMIGL
jgi:hypothetical protein